MEGYEHVQRVRSRGLKTADLSYQGGRPNIRPKDKLKRPPSRLSNPIECASRQQVLRERTGGCSPDEYAESEDDGKHREGWQHDSLSVRAADRRAAGRQAQSR